MARRRKLLLLGGNREVDEVDIDEVGSPGPRGRQRGPIDTVERERQRDSVRLLTVEGRQDPTRPVMPYLPPRAET